MAEKNINYGVILSLIITLTGWGVTFGVCKNKIDNNAVNITRIEKQHQNDVDRLDTRQAGTDILLQSINAQLVELNTKMTLLLNGKLQPEA